MRVKFIIIFLFLLGSQAHSQDQESRSDQGTIDEDSLAVERRKEYEARLQFIEEIKRRREKDPERYADSIAQIKELKRYAKAIDRIDGYRNRNIEELTEIDLTGARLQELPDWISEARNVEILVLDYNRISVLPKWLGELEQLKRIYVRHCNLKNSELKIPRIEGIEKVDLTGNTFSKLPKVHRFKGLKELIIEDNEFTKIPTWRARRLKNLKELDLSQNPLTVDRRWYGLLDHIQILKLNKCEIEELDPSIYRMTGLKELQIQVNELDSVPNGISALSNLEKLSFYKNQLKNFPADFFDLKKLVVVDFYYNEFEKIPPQIGDLKNLEVLYLSFNQLYDIPAELNQLSKLRELYVHHNRLSELPGGLDKLQMLRIFHFQNNYIPDFPTQVLNMKSLVDLDISNTDITVLPEDISELRLENFYWRNLNIDLNDPRNRKIGEILVELSAKGTNVVPSISNQEISD